MTQAVCFETACVTGLGFRIMWQHDADLSFTTLTDSERYYFMYDERWRIIGTFRDQDVNTKESFVCHASGIAGRGGSSYIDSVILRDRDTSRHTMPTNLHTRPPLLYPHPCKPSAFTPSAAPKFCNLNPCQTPPPRQPKP